MSFTFKQFHVEHDQCAMKVGTDSILLGAWAPIAPSNKALDIGCGSGLLCLILAQRMGGTGQISGVEIDPQAAAQARQNVAASPWSEIIKVYQGDITKYYSEQLYDVIISNPPYFADSLQGPAARRNIARHNDNLTIKHLLHSVDGLLAKSGCFSLILPTKEGTEMIEQSGSSGLYLKRCSRVYTKPDKPVHRYLLTFVREKNTAPEYSNLAIYDENNQYSNQFIALTHDFYLNRKGPTAI
ncbi:MAG: tRNA1Val (adenine37-N6)-methyltransferase [Alteromonadaceae bacterium]|jgi:tRNA1Val (adenine37-N6)-methyltransferase